MTPDSPPAPRPYRRLRVPAFYPVPTRTRRDGWTVERQADFLGMLAETQTRPLLHVVIALGSLLARSGAGEADGMSRKSACRLHRIGGSMASATIGTIRAKTQRLSPPNAPRGSAVRSRERVRRASLACVGRCW